MTKEQQAIRSFMELAGQDTPEKPVVPDWNTRVLRTALIREELDELSAAFDEGDIRGVADAVGDLLYVVLGTAVACGIDMEPIFWEIHRSNMSKFIDGHRRDDGKWIKGPSYTPAAIEPLLQIQAGTCVPSS